MIGIEINFINVKDNCDDVICDVEEPLFGKANASLKSDLFEWLKTGNKLEINVNEYWGDENDYNFNDCFSRHTIDSIHELDMFNINTFKFY